MEKRGKVSFVTFGCRLNHYDTELLLERFISSGYEIDNENPDILVVNTCCVTSRACKDARHVIRQAKSPVIVTGCYSKIAKEEISKLPNVSLVEGDIQELSMKLGLSMNNVINHFYGYNKAFVKIQEGCDHFCSYCIVPYVRGKPKDREINEIMNEIDCLTRNGYTEIILTGTNITKYKNILNLLELIERNENVKRFGFGSIEPIGITDEILEFISYSNKFNKYFHIPLQSGDERILKLMKRWYTPQDYAEIIYKIKEKINDVAIGADVIVGFPTESEEEFYNTYKFIENTPIDRLHVFRYSPRPMTDAAKLKNDVPENVKCERSYELRKLSENNWLNFRKKYLGKILDVHVESKKFNNYFVGLTSNYIKIYFNSCEYISDYVKVKVKEVDKKNTYGEIQS